MITQHQITKQEFLEKESKIFDRIQDLNTPQLLAVMGVTNAYCWAALERLELLENNKLLPQKAGDIIAASQTGVASIEMTNIYLSAYLKKHWSGACSSEHSCRNVRQLLSTGLWKTRTNQDTGEIEEVWGLGFLDFTPKLSGTTVIPPTLENMDLVGMAQLYRCAYQLWKEKMIRKFPDTDPFDLLPEHKGALMLTLFDSLFYGMIQFNSVGFERSLIEVNVESVVKSVKRAVMWFFSESYKICRRGWRRLIKREFEQQEREYQQNLTEMGVAF